MLLDSRAEEMPVTPFGPHQPVLPREVLELLKPQAGATIVDGTFGPGGHSELLLDAVGKEGRVIGIDRDATAIDHARTLLESQQQQLPQPLEAALEAASQASEADQTTEAIAHLRHAVELAQETGFL